MKQLFSIALILFMILAIVMTAVITVNSPEAALEDTDYSHRSAEYTDIISNTSLPKASADREGISNNASDSNNSAVIVMMGDEVIVPEVIVPEVASNTMEEAVEVILGPKDLRENAIYDLLLINSSNKCTQKLIKDAIIILEETLSDKLWRDDDRLNYSYYTGANLFEQDRIVIRQLEIAKCGDRSAVTQLDKVITSLLVAEEMLVTTAIEDADSVISGLTCRKIIGADREIFKAQSALNDAHSYLDRGRQFTAINCFKSAWLHAQGANKIAHLC